MPVTSRSLFCLISQLLVLALQTSALAQSASNGIAAIVNGNVITKSEVREAVVTQEQMLRFQIQNDPAALERELRNLHATALDSLIDRELVLAEFKRIGAVFKSQWVDDDINGIIRDSFKGNRDAFIKDLAGTGMTVKKFRDMREKMMIVQAMRGKQASQQAPATPKEIEDFYKKNIEKWREGGMIKISTITIPKFSAGASGSVEDQIKIAQEIRGKLLKGADFATTAKTYSQDSHAEDGGAWDWIARDQMKPSIAKVAFSLKTGGLSEVINDEAAYIIIACDAIKPGSVKSLQELRPEIEHAVSSEKSKGVIDKWMEGLRKRAVIKKFGN